MLFPISQEPLKIHLPTTIPTVVTYVKYTQICQCQLIFILVTMQNIHFVCTTLQFIVYFTYVTTVESVLMIFSKVAKI